MLEFLEVGVGVSEKLKEYCGDWLGADVELATLLSVDVEGVEALATFEKVDVTVVSPTVMTVIPCPAPTPSPPPILDWLVLTVEFVKPDEVRETEVEMEPDFVVMADPDELVGDFDSVSGAEPVTASVAAVV